MPKLRRFGVFTMLLSLALTTGNVRADIGLTGLVNSVYGARVQDAALHDVAHQRAVEISVTFSHAGRRAGTSEVLAWNQGYADPVTHAVGQWVASPTHSAVLANPDLTRMGCGAHVTDDGRYFAACVLMPPIPSPALSPPAGPAPTPPVQVLPDAATGCRPIPVEWFSPTGIAGCIVYGEGTASRWQGPGVARNDCQWPWDACTPIVITSLETGRSITVTPTMFGDLYTGTSDERIVDLDPAAVEALGLDWEQGLYAVRVTPAMQLPDTRMP